jgi:RimJ/RimL family protein N-acetyltransferase
LVRPLTTEEAVLLLDQPAAFTRLTALDVAPGYLAFPDALPRIVDGLRAGHQPEWGTHLIVDGATSTVVGLGGFKGPPASGVVEIGYSVAPDHRGRGHARRAVMSWVGLASRAGVGCVLAHTLPAASASTRILERCGFARVPGVADDDAGTVWRWRLDLHPATRRTAVDTVPRGSRADDRS